MNNTWRPTIVVTGMSGFPPVEKAGNVLRDKTSCRISVRLPPTFDCNKAKNIILDILTKDPPFNAKITAYIGHSGNGWSSKDLCDSLKKSFNNSSRKLFKTDFYNFGGGGSCAFVHSLEELFPKCEIVVTGVLGPGSNEHCLNESLNLEYTKNMIVTLSHAINDFCQ